MGILQENMVQPRAAPTAPDFDVMGGGFPDSSEASQEEQEAKDQVVTAGMKYLFDGGKPTELAVKRLKAQGGEPAKALADYTVTLIAEMDERSGNTIPEEVIVPAAVELLENVTELAAAADIFPVDEAVMNLAAQHLMVGLGDEYGADPAEIQQMMGSLDPEALKQIESQQGNFARKQPPMEMMTDGQSTR